MGRDVHLNDGVKRLVAPSDGESILDKVAYALERFQAKVAYVLERFPANVAYVLERFPAKVAYTLEKYSICTL